MLAAAAVLVALFLYNVDIGRVAREILHAQPAWLALAVATMLVNLTIRTIRWQYLLAPLGRVSFGAAFRATAVGYAATTIFPARAGEVIRPYFLARSEASTSGMSATGAFATIILERMLDVIAVVALLASFVFVFGRDLTAANPVAFTAVKWTGATVGAVTLAGLIVAFVLAGDPARLAQAMTRLEQVMPSSLAGLIARIAEKFATGLGAVRRPGRLLGALAWSIPLWLSIACGIWSVAEAFRLTIPFTGSFLLVALLVLGVAVPTPGAVGGFHEAFRLGATTFYGVPDARAVGAAIVLHVISIGPSLALGLYFAAQAGLNFSRMKELAEVQEVQEVQEVRDVRKAEGVRAGDAA